MGLVDRFAVVLSAAAAAVAICSCGGCVEISHKPGVVHNEAIHIPGSVEITDGGGEVTHEIHDGEGEDDGEGEE
jgi:hypothetical protein